MSFIRRSNPRYSILVIFFVLMAIGISLILHRHWVYEVPLVYGETQTIWSVEAKVEFEAAGEPVKVSLVRPTNQEGFVVLEENGASPGYGLNFIDGDNPRAEWTVRAANGSQELFYRADILVTQQQPIKDTQPAPEIQLVTWPEPYNNAVADVLTQAYATSADNFSLTRELLKHFSSNQGSQHVELLKSRYKKEIPQLLVDMLHKADVPASLIYALELRDGRRRQNLEPMLRVWQGEQTQTFAIPKHNAALDLLGDAPILLWEQTGVPVLDVVGATNSRVRFSMIQRQESTFSNVALSISNQYDFFNFSIHSLPVEEQALFKSILLLPIGALVVCILRVLVGLKTSGTFMPVLIALAFVQTSLVVGLIGFLVVVSTGLLIRSYLSRLNLLLVPRITAVIIMVIALIGVFSVLSYKLGLTEGLRITFFPMIILSWTIERMSILWEEEGRREVIKQGGGSLLTAVLAYYAMTDPWIRHLTFNFIGLQFVVLALVILIGSYTGYRLLELKRFSEIGR